MATRAEMVDQAASVLAQEYEEAGERFHDGTDFENATSAILNAVLPVVSTVAELKALPSWTVLVSANGKSFEGVMNLTANRQLWRRNSEDWAPEDLVSWGPLTVVWRP